MIDKALANADKGVCKDAGGFEKELLSESEADREAVSVLADMLEPRR